MPDVWPEKPGKTATGDGSEPRMTLLAALDFGHGSLELVRRCLDMAQVGRTTVILLHVVPPLATPFKSGGVLQAKRMRPMRDAVADQMASFIVNHGIGHLARERGIHLVTGLEHGPPGRGILSAAERFGASLIVMGRGCPAGGGNNGEGLGNTLLEVLRNASISVMMVGNRPE